MYQNQLTTGEVTSSAPLFGMFAALFPFALKNVIDLLAVVVAIVSCSCCDDLSAGLVGFCLAIELVFFSRAKGLPLTISSNVLFCFGSVLWAVVAASE